MEHLKTFKISENLDDSGISGISDDMHMIFKNKNYDERHAISKNSDFVRKKKFTMSS